MKRDADQRGEHDEADSPHPGQTVTMTSPPRKSQILPWLQLVPSSTTGREARKKHMWTKGEDAVILSAVRQGLGRGSVPFLCVQVERLLPGREESAVYSRYFKLKKKDPQLKAAAAAAAPAPSFGRGNPDATVNGKNVSSAPSGPVPLSSLPSAPPADTREGHI